MILDNRTAIVTGGSKGIGQAIAKREYQIVLKQKGVCNANRPTRN